jgi:hypothetical protein
MKSRGSEWNISTWMEMFKHVEGGMFGGLTMNGAELGLYRPFCLGLGGRSYT